MRALRPQLRPHRHPSRDISATRSISTGLSLNLACTLDPALAGQLVSPEPKPCPPPGEARGCHVPSLHGTPTGHHLVSASPPRPLPPQVTAVGFVGRTTQTRALPDALYTFWAASPHVWISGHADVFSLGCAWPPPAHLSRASQMDAMLLPVIPSSTIMHQTSCTQFRGTGA